MSAPFFQNRVKESTTTSGTGTFSLGGAVTSAFRAFANACTTGQQVWYSAYDPVSNAWEIGLGTFTSGSPNTLSRDEVLASSNSGSLVNFSASPQVWCDLPAEAVDAINVSAFGIKADGSTDDTAAINKWISWLNTYGGDFAFPSGATSITSGGHTLSGSGFRIHGNGCTLKVKNGTAVGGSGYGLWFSGSFFSVESLLIDANRANRTPTTAFSST